jgi:hypothetical protein
MYSSAELDAAAGWFTTLARKVDFEFQILCITDAIDIDRFVKSRVTSQMRSEHGYLEWWSDYHNKWLSRVGDLHYLSYRQFYVVVPSEKQASRAKTQAQRQQAILDERLNFMLENLQSAGLKPTVLNRQQARTFLQSRINPVSKDLQLVEIPEYESKSTLCLPRAYERAREMQIAGSYTSTQFLTMLPSEVSSGWFMNWLTMFAPNSVSIHLRPGMPTPDKKKRVSMSVAFTTWGNNCEELLGQNESMRRRWTDTGAILDKAETWQFEGWLSSLPIARNAIPLTHTVEPEIIGDTYPFIDVKCGHECGTIFGFSAWSREPVLLNPFDEVDHQKKNTLVCTTEMDKIYMTKLLLSRLLPIGAKMVVVDDSGSMDFLCSTIGTSDAEIIEAGQDGTLDASSFGDKLLQVYALERCSSAEARLEAQLTVARKALEFADHKLSERLILLFSEISELASCQTGQRLIRQLCNLEDPNLSLILATSRPEITLKKATVVDALRSFPTKIITPNRSDAALQALKKLHLNDAEIAAIAVIKPEEKDHPCLLHADGRKAMVNVIPSPQEFWLLGDTAEQVGRRKKKLEELKTQNPSINLTDSHRRAVYDLSLEA